MKHGLSRIMFCSFAFLLFSAAISDAIYIEGIDTTGPYSTDSKSFGLDSLFYYSSITGLLYLNGTICQGMSYEIPNMCQAQGYFNCPFDSVIVVPDTIRLKGGTASMLSAFIIENKKDSTWSKIQIIKKTGDGRYVYKYGKNTTPNNKLLIDNGYDRSIKYKPNNLYNVLIWKENVIHDAIIYPFADTLFWDPPIPNNNHLTGYILYAKNYNDTDIIKPQWDSIASFPASTREAIIPYELSKSCINLVAVYDEGRSEFLDGLYVPVCEFPNAVSRPGFVFSKVQKKLSITTVPHGLIITAPSLSPAGPFSVTIYNPNGTIHSRISGIKGNRTFLSAQCNEFTGGLYFLRAEFADRSVVIQPFTIVQ